MNKLKNLLAPALLTAGTVLFASSAHAMTCYDAVRIVSQRLSDLNEKVYQTQIGSFAAVPHIKMGAGISFERC